MKRWPSDSMKGTLAHVAMMSCIASAVVLLQPAPARADSETSSQSEKAQQPEMTPSELNVLLEQLGGCWAAPMGIGDGINLRASVYFRLDRDGKLDGLPKIVKSSGNADFDDSAIRAIRKCDVQGFALPADKHDAWREITIHFDPGELH